MSAAPKIAIKSKKRTSDTLTESLVDAEEQAQKADEAQSTEDTEKAKKREYQKRKVKKQRQNKRGLEIVETVDEPVSVDFRHHLGLHHVGKAINKKNKRHGSILQKQDHLKDLLANDERSDVLLDNKTIKEINNKKEDKITKLKAKKPEFGKKWDDERSKQLALMGDIIDNRETWATTQIIKEKAKHEYFAKKEQDKIERKEKKKKIENMVYAQLVQQRAEQRKEDDDIKKER